jgi:peptide/nickel transport system permease protein
MGLRHYIARRVLFAVPTFIGVTFIIFVVMHSVGDPITMMLEREVGFQNLGAFTGEQIQELREFYGLDKPIWQQYLVSLSNTLRGDLGISFSTRRPVWDTIFDRLPATLEMQILSQILSLSISIPAGIYAATHAYTKRDFALVSFTLLGISLPYFWFALLLVIFFAGNLGWFPAYGFISIGEPLYGSVILDNLWHIALPLTVMTFTSLAGTTRIMRQNMLEIIKEDYITAARSLGLRERIVIYKHALRNAIIPIVTGFGWRLAALIGGSAVTETIFGWPGIGRLFVTALQGMDFPLVSGIIVITSILILGGNLIGDILYSVVDPRIALE